MTSPGDRFPAAITVVGEAVVDRVRRAEGTLRETPGGSPANVALGLARLGHPTTFLTQLGEDAAGALLRDHLQGAGVILDVSTTPSGRTSTALATLAADGSATYEFDLAFALPPLTTAEIDRLCDVAVLHVGSVSAILGEDWGRVRDLAGAARGAALVSYDVNLRPALTGAGDDVRARVEALAATADLVKASDEDLAALWPGLAPHESAAHLLSLGASAVVVTLGGDGCLAITSALDVRRPAHRTTVVDTIGAGDSFMAGLLHAVAGTDLALLDAPAWERVLDRAAANAAFTVAHAGAAMPSPAEVANPDLDGE
ncbi:carbohydrate kinase [Nocardioides sp.]|uniref:carbohydrate kinase family protein n=1 Tax=Nocardioides sp. TaxID=35761 RepID=UPI00261D8F28|nr:carbohydrate kinase [Nocardioides sp.]